MLNPDFDPEPVAVASTESVTSRSARPADAWARAIVVAEKIDGAGRHVRQIELC